MNQKVRGKGTDWRGSRKAYFSFSSCVRASNEYDEIAIKLHIGDPRLFD